MQEEAKPSTAASTHGSAVTKRATDSPEQRDSNILALISGDLLTGLSVFQIDTSHQQTLLQVAAATAREAGAARGIRGSAIFRGTGGGDVAIFTQWMNRRDYDQARQTLLTPPEQDLYRIAVVDHTSGQDASRIAREDGLFHFINVFSLAPGSCAGFVDYFQHLFPSHAGSQDMCPQICWSVWMPTTQ